MQPNASEAAIVTLPCARNRRPASQCLMSSSSSDRSANANAPAIASSSRTSPTDEHGSDDGLEIQNEELLAEDPLHNGGLDGTYVILEINLRCDAV